MPSVEYARRAQATTPSLSVDVRGIPCFRKHRLFAYGKHINDIRPGWPKCTVTYNIMFYGDLNLEAWVQNATNTGAL